MIISFISQLCPGTIHPPTQVHHTSWSDPGPYQWHCKAGPKLGEVCGDRWGDIVAHIEYIVQLSYGQLQSQIHPSLIQVLLTRMFHHRCGEDRDRCGAAAS